jgi:TonB family protein
VSNLEKAGAAIGIVGSVITIFAFVSGWPNFKEAVTNMFGQGTPKSEFHAPYVNADTISHKDTIYIPPISQDSTQTNDTLKKAKIYDEVDRLPEYPMGKAAMVDFISSTLVYPDYEKNNLISGTVLIRTLVNLDGSLDSIKVYTGVSDGLNKEALRIVGMLPLFIPGLKDSKPVRTYFYIPIVFNLPDKQGGVFPDNRNVPNSGGNGLNSPQGPQKNNTTTIPSGTAYNSPSNPPREYVTPPQNDVYYYNGGSRPNMNVPNRNRIYQNPNQKFPYVPYRGGRSFQPRPNNTAIRRSR